MHRIRFILTLLTAVLFFLSFPPFATGYLAFIAFIPFLALLECNGFRSGFRTGYTVGLLSLGAMLYWLNWNSGADALQATGMYLAMVLYLALWWGAFGWLQGLFGRAFGTKGFLVAPLLWTSLEYLQSFGELGFTWHSFATPLSAYPTMIQFISYTGMFALPFWVMSVNVSLFLVIKFLMNAKNRQPRHSATFFAVVTPVLILSPILWSLFLLPAPERRSGKSITVAIVQPNIEPNRKWLERDFAFRTLMNQTRSLRGKPKDMIIWPETAIPVRLRWDPFKLNRIIDEITLQNTVMLTGIPDKRFTENKDGSMLWRSYNSVYLIRQDSTIETYDKMHLVPLGEYVPGILLPIKTLAMDVGASDYAAGDSMMVFTIEKTDTLTGQRIPYRFSTVICLESVFAPIVREGVVRGAEFLVIVTNDAWYDATIAPEQHAQIAVLRAIENRIPVVRCANSGVSCIIDPAGRILTRTPNPSEAMIYETISLEKPGSFYTRHGDWFPVSVGAVTLIMLVWSAGLFIRNKKSPKQSGNAH